MTWSARRRLIILIIILAFIGGTVFFFTYPIIFQAPTCFDGIQNGDETGIDCGGICTKQCTAEIKIPNVLWARSFPVSNNVYNVIAYIENKNESATSALPYEFRLYNNDGVFVSRIDGTALIPPLGRYAIIETGIQVGNAIVGHTNFEFSKNPVEWQRLPSNINSLKTQTSNISLDTKSLIPKLTANIKNTSTVTTLINTKVIAILYDAKDNAVNVSKTVIPTLAPDTTIPIFFTWPKAFSVPVVRFELIPVIDVFSTK